MFITALFIIARTWKQPRCPSADKRRQMWYMYAVEYYSTIKKDELPPITAMWMDLEIHAK